MAYTDHFETVQKLYIAYYQRPADPAGLRYWSQVIEANGGDAASAVDAFATSTEANDLYGTINATSIATVVKAIYAALFNRTVADADDGLKFYVDGFNAGTYTAGSIALNVLSGAGGVDAVALQNKLTVANLFTKVVDGRALTDPAFGGGKSAVTYDNKDAKAARDILKAVDANPSNLLDEAEVKIAIISNNITDPGDALDSSGTGNTLTLTTKNGETMTGTSGDDIFYAALGNSSQATLNSTDTVIGNGGYDTIHVEYNSNSNRISSTTKFVGISKLIAESIDSTASAFSISGTKNIQSIKDIEVFGKVTDVTIDKFDDLQSVSIAHEADAANHNLTGKSINNVSIIGNHTNTLTVDIDNTNKTSVKSLDISIDGVGYDGNTSKDFVLNIGKGVETLNITASENKSVVKTIAATHGSGAVKLSKITVDGDADLTIDLGANNSAKVSSFDASNAEGKIKVSVTAVRNNASIIGGDNADTITVASTAGYVTLTGGGGKDTFDLSALKVDKGIATITDFEVGDTIKMGFSNLKSTTLDDSTDISSSVVSGIMPNITTILGGSNFDPGIENAVHWFEFENDIYLVFYGGNKNEKLGADDAVVKLAGFDSSLLSKMSVNSTGEITLSS